MRSSSHTRWSRLAKVAIAALVSALIVPASPIAVSMVSAAGLGAGGEYHPLTPQRVYDSRAPDALNQGIPGPMPATPTPATFDISLLGQGGVPNRAADVLAVVVNITIDAPTGEGWLNAYGAGAPAGDASIINFTPNQIVPNLSIVRPGTDGKLTIKLFSTSPSGTAHVIVDVFGWFSTSSNADAGARLIPVPPGRLLDTRDPAGPRANTPLGTAESLELGIRGAVLQNGQTIPDSPDVVGVVLNLTGVNDLPNSTGTFLSVLPDAPTGTVATSNVNLSRNQVKPNMVMVPVGADGKVRVYNNSGATHVVVDVAGYLLADQDPATRAGRVIPLTSPFRVFDTRQPQWGSVSLGAGQSEDWSFADFVGSVNIGGVSVGNQSAVIGNLTSASLSGSGASYLTVHPSDAGRPVASNLNTLAGTDPVPNLAIMKYSASKTVRVFNQQGNSHYLYDAAAVILAD